MADDEGRPESEPPRPLQATPNRGKRRDAPLIEGEARDVPASSDDPPPTGTASLDGSEDMSVHEPAMSAGTEAQAAAELAAPDRPAEAFAAPAEPRSRMPMLLGVIGAVLILLLAVNLYTMYNPPNADAVGAVTARVASLDGRVAGLESRASPPPDLAPLDGRIKALEQAVAELKTGLAEARQKIDAQPASAPAPAAADAGAADQSAALQAKIADLGQSVSALQAAAAAPPKGDLEAKVGELDQSVGALKADVAAIPKTDLAPLDTKLAALGAAVAALQTAVAAVPKVDLGPLDDKIAALDGRLAPIEAQFATPKLTQQVTVARQEGSAAESRAAPLAVTAQATLQAIEDGKPFTAEVAALQSLGTDEAKLGALKPVATKGAPTQADLVTGFAAVRDAIVGAAAPPVTGTVLDRMMASAESFVKVRPAGASPGSDPAAVASRIDADLKSGAFPEALNEWTGLPDVSKAASMAWADQLKARVAAEQAAQSIVAGAITALGATQ